MLSPNAIKVRRKAAGLTAIELANRLGVREATVYRWEQGKQAPTLHMSKALARELGVSLDELFGEAS